MTRKMSRRTFLRTATMLMGTSLAAACGAGPTPTPVVITKEVTKEVVKARPKLTFWISHPFLSRGSEALLKTQVLDYAQQQGFDVTYLQEDMTNKQKINAALESKQLPDVFYTEVTDTQTMYRTGQLADMTSLVTELNKNMGGFTPGVLAAVTVNGKQIGVPFAVSTEMFYARKDALDAAKLPLPLTWDDVFADARKVHNPPKLYGLGLAIGAGNNDAETMMNGMLWAYGGGLWAKDGKTIALDSPVTRQLLTMLKKAWDEGLWPKDAITGDTTWNNNAYLAGTIAFTQNTGSIAKSMKDSNPALLANTSLYAPPGGPNGRFVYGIGLAFAVPNYTKVPELAQGVIRAVSSPDNYQALQTELAGFRVPCYAGLGNMAMWADPLMKPLGEAMPLTYMAGYPGPVTPDALQCSSQRVLAGMAAHVLVDGWSNDQAIADCIKQVQTIQAAVAGTK